MAYCMLHSFGASTWSSGPEIHTQVPMFSMFTTAPREMMQIYGSANSICSAAALRSPIFERMDNWQRARLQTITLMLFTCNANDW